MTIYFILAAYSALLAGIVVFLIFETYTLLIAPAKGSPYAPTKRGQIIRMLEIAGVNPGELMLDLGSGTGSALIAAAAQGARATGIEINPFFVWYSRWRIRRRGLSHLASVARGDLFEYPTGDADVIFLFLVPDALRRLYPKLRSELKPGSRIVSYLFPIDGWMPEKEEDRIFLYSNVIQAKLTSSDPS